MEQGIQADDLANAALPAGSIAFELPDRLRLKNDGVAYMVKHPRRWPPGQYMIAAR